MESFYGLLNVIGPIILIAAIAWAVLHNRRTPREEARTEEATRQMYDAQNADDKADEVK